MKFRFTVPRAHLSGFVSTAYVEGDEDPLGALREAVLSDLETEIDVEVGGVTMRLSHWTNPDHWEDDWAAKLGVPADDVYEAIADLLARAAEERARAP